MSTETFVSLTGPLGSEGNIGGRPHLETPSTRTRVRRDEVVSGGLSLVFSFGTSRPRFCKVVQGDARSSVE